MEEPLMNHAAGTMVPATAARATVLAVPDGVAGAMNESFMNQ